MANFNRQITGIEAVRRALGEMGVRSRSQISDVAGSTDMLLIQIWELASACGRELAGLGDWKLLSRAWEFTTTPPTKLYTPPADFDHFVPVTGWNNTARIPLIGPLTSQQWRMLQARQLGGTTLRLQYQYTNNQVEFYFVPDTPQTMAIEYISRGWVSDATVPATKRDYLENNGDLILFDADLFVQMLKYKWREAKGFDTTASKQVFEDMLEGMRNKDAPGTDLAIGNTSAYPYLGYYNMPDTGYGQS